MTKVVTFTGVYVISSTANANNGGEDTLDIVYGLVDSDGIEYPTKFIKVPYAELSVDQKEHWDDLVDDAIDVAEKKEDI